MNPIIEFKDFCFKYRTQEEETLHSINLSIRPGEKILVTGPSGCGKSTLVHCLNALIPCSYHGNSTGTLTVDGKDPAKAGVFGMARSVGTVLQDTDGQFIGITVAEDLAFALENDAVPQKEIFRRVNEAAALVGMENFLRHSPGKLSGGQKQRVSLGGVLVDDVKILLFDEPLANLDPATGKRTIELIDRIMKEKSLTVIIVEHRLEDVLWRDVDRIIVMKDGAIAADLPPDELLASDILPAEGIREPLYVTAVKHALAFEGECRGIRSSDRSKLDEGECRSIPSFDQLQLDEGECRRIRPEDHPQHIETMNLEPYKDAVRAWFHAQPPVIRENTNDPVLEVRNLSFGYTPERQVLHNISFTIRKGEMLSIVGKNGAGKSTLSSLICGFINPDEGEILLNGKDISPLSVKERGEHIGLVMQSPNQMISKPMIREETGLGLSVRGVPEDEIKTRVEETLRICGLYPMRNWPVGALSFGQKKRVSIASILVMNPKILILDEPTAGQDFRHYTEIMEFLKKLNKELGLTILLITHDMHLMLEYTDRTIVLADGRLLADDLPSRILTDPETAERACLKKTSLYDLALRCGIEEADQFAQRFIEYERGLRNSKEVTE